MTATLAGLHVSRALLRIPRWGAAMADVDMIDDTALEVGSRATLALGDLSLVGTIRPGGSFGGTAAYSWIAGGGGWASTVEALPYHNDAGIMLSAVASDLAADAGEFGAVLEVADRSLGQTWTRPRGAARDQLDALSGGQWWVAADGVTHLGPRSSTSISSSTLTVTHYDPALRRAVVQVADDAIAALAPGVTLTAPGLPAPLTIGAVDVAVTAERLQVVLWGEATGAELFARIVAHLTAGTAYHSLAPYAVQSVGADGRVAVKPADGRVPELPDASAIGHVPGLPGASYTLQPGAGVLVAWVAGDPGSPVCVAYPAGVLPASVLLDAGSSIAFGSGAALPLVVASDASWFAQVAAAIQAIKTGASGGTASLVAACAGLTLSAPTPSVADKAKASHV